MKRPNASDSLQPDFEDLLAGEHDAVEAANNSRLDPLAEPPGETERRLQRERRDHMKRPEPVDPFPLTSSSGRPWKLVEAVDQDDATMQVNRPPYGVVDPLRMVAKAAASAEASTQPQFGGGGGSLGGHTPNPNPNPNPFLAKQAAWDERFMDLAREIGSWSKDRSRKVGCVLVGPAREIRATGYNGFPRGVNDDVEARHQRPAKYRWTEHAERNAIYNAARSGVATDGCTAYLPWFPCVDCARALIQAGITTLVCIEPDWEDATFGADFKVAVEMMNEVGLLLRFAAGTPPVQQK